MAAGLKGAFTCFVFGGKDLKNTATLGKQDPYCKLTIGSSTQKTSVHKDGGTTPNFNGQAFTFNLAGSEDMLHIAVCEEGAVSDSNIGRMDVNLKTLLEHAGRKWYPLSDFNNFKVQAGYLELACEFKGTGAPAVLSKSAEVLAAEQKASAQQGAMNAQQMELEKMRLEVEKMKLQQQMAAQHQHPQVVQQPVMQQPVVVQPVYQQPQQPFVQQPMVVQQPVFVQPQIMQQPVMVQQVVEMKASPAPTGAHEDNFRWCVGCACLFRQNIGSGRCPATGGGHDGSKSQNYAVQCQAPTGNKSQQDWSVCNKCAVLVYKHQNAACPGGGIHDYNGQPTYWGAMEGWNKDSQNNWRWCKKCDSMFFGGSIGVAKCCSGSGHTTEGSGEYHVAFNVAPPAQIEDNFRWCVGCACMVANNFSTGRCPASGAAHDLSKSGSYAIHRTAPGHKAQQDWSVCNKCAVLVYKHQNAACPAGGIHDYNGQPTYYGSNEGWNGQGHQSNWRWCKKCDSMFFGGSIGVAKCCSGSGHTTEGSGEYFPGLNYTGPGIIAAALPYEGNMRWCCVCACMVRAGTGVSRCVNGGAHDISKSGQYIIHKGTQPKEVGTQAGWKSCTKCGVMGYQHQNASCWAGGIHDFSSQGDFFCASGQWNNNTTQNNWRWCKRCDSLFFGGSIGVAKCPSGQGHTTEGSGEYFPGQK